MLTDAVVIGQIITFKQCVIVMMLEVDLEEENRHNEKTGTIAQPV